MQISSGSPDPVVISDAGGNYTFFGTGNGSHHVRELLPAGFTRTTPASGVYDVTIAAGQVVSGQNFGNRATFRVLAAEPTSTGVTIQFNRDMATDMLNLYDIQGGGIGPADVTLVGAAGGNIRGSVVIDPGLRRLTFVRTLGLLPPDDYTLTLRSAPDGFQDLSAELLDGDANGAAGANFTTTFTIAPPSAGAVIVSIPKFARGPRQPVNLPANGVNGLPVTLSDGSGITSATLQIAYNPALLNVSAAAVAAGLPAGASVMLNNSAPGLATLQFNSPTPLPAGTVRIVDLQATVPMTAPYRSQHVLDIANVSLNGGSIVALADDAVHVVAYFGDATGDGAYSAQDASRVSRLGVGLDSGLQLFQLLDPLIVADITGNGAISAADASRALQVAVGIITAEVPPLP
jgi:hypothetical protein